MRFPVYKIFILLMLVGNCFGLYQLLTSRQEFISKYPALNNENYFILPSFPIINIVAITGLLFLKRWSVYPAIIGALVIIAADIYFGIRYHLYVAGPSLLVLLFFIIKYRNHFK